MSLLEDLRILAGLTFVLLIPFRAYGHAIEGTIIHGGIAVELRYADGSPAAGTQVSVFAPAATNPTFQFLADETGRIVFFPNTCGLWKIEADDGMGHLVVLSTEIDPKPGSPPDNLAPTFARLCMNRFWPALAGLGCIWGIFGTMGWWMASRRR